MGEAKRNPWMRSVLLEPPCGVTQQANLGPCCVAPARGLSVACDCTPHSALSRSMGGYSNAALAGWVLGELGVHCRSLCAVLCMDLGESDTTCCKMP